MLKRCQHDYKPHKFIRCETDEYGKTMNVYELQCMKCGKKPFFICKKSREMLTLRDFEMEKLFQNENI